MPGQPAAAGKHCRSIRKALELLPDRSGSLTVIAALSCRWGCERTGYRRKVVWAELAP